MGHASGERMRVAYLVNRYPSLSHGFIRREIAALEACGVEVERVSIRREPEALLPDEADLAERARTRVLLDRGAAGLLADALVLLARRPRAWWRALREAVALGWRSDRGLLVHAVYLAEACTLVRRLEASGARHLHAHFGTNPAAVALLCRRLGGPPFSFTAHGTESFERPAAVKLGRKAASADFVVAVCEYGREQVRRAAAGRGTPRIEVVRCGLDRDFLDAPPTPVPDAPRLVCVARLAPEKGLLVLLDAAARLAEEDVASELVVAGDGALRDAIRAQLLERDLARRVHLAGSLSSAGVRKEIQAARALVLPSLAEGLPVVLMEAFALGRPVVATAVGGVAELVEPGASGWLVPPGDPAALARALREALAAPPERLAEMGRRGRERVLARHDVRREAERLAALFAESAGLPGRRS